MSNIHPADQRYVEQLGGYNLDRLSKEPVKLSIERRKIESKIEQLTLDNYRVHVDSYRAVRAAAGACNNMQSTMNNVESIIADIQQQQESSVQAATAIAKTYQSYRQTLRQHSQLVEILEIPQLIARCVRVHAVDESLELANFVIKMERVHALRQKMRQTDLDDDDAKNKTPTKTTIEVSGLTIIRDIKCDVFRSLDMLYTKLTDKLSSRINLTDSLRTVGYLRRLRHLRKSEQDATLPSSTNQSNQLSSSLSASSAVSGIEMEIHETFLHCREVFFQREIDQITNTEPYEYLESLVEVYRIYLYDIISQYQNIFIEVEDEVNGKKSSSSSSSTTTTTTTTTTTSITKQQQHLSTCIFSHLSHLLSQIKVLLPVIDDGSLLFNILEQTMNLGQSLSKVGCDFRPLLAAPFENAMLNLIRPTWNEGRIDFHEAMSLETGWHRLSQSLKAVEDDEMKEKQNQVKSSTSYSSTSTDVHYYHQRLLTCRPLAHMTNSMIDGFNELRKCSSMSIRDDVLNEILEVLKDVWKVVCNTNMKEKVEEVQNDDGSGDKSSGSGSRSSSSSSSGKKFNCEEARRSLKSLVRLDFVGVIQYCFGEIFGFDGINMAKMAGILADETEEVVKGEILTATSSVPEKVSEQEQ
jgi:hypothetical protein